MHVRLNADEIVRLVICELVASEAKVTGVALASCRKNFEDLVLDMLWETQDQLLPLFKSLLGDVWNEGGCTVSAPKTWVFSFLDYLNRKPFKRLPTGFVARSTLDGSESSEDMAF
jgi:hypothetical protein